MQLKDTSRVLPVVRLADSPKKKTLAQTTCLNWTEPYPNDTQNVAPSGRDGPVAVHVACQYYSSDQKPESPQLKTPNSLNIFKLAQS